jgi:rfaE bifunctional protein nucleotidyltransferase chain/domain
MVSTGPSDHIMSLARVARLTANLRRRKPGARVVLANGIFDLFHVGHLRYLRAAAELGDFLVVAVNDDRSARRLRGPGRPIMPASDRARVIAALRGVDAVLVFPFQTVARILLRLRPDIHCKGTDYTVTTVPEQEIVSKYGGRVMIAGDPKRHASTSIIAAIVRSSGPRGRRE